MIITINIALYLSPIVTLCYCNIEHTKLHNHVHANWWETKHSSLAFEDMARPLLKVFESERHFVEKESTIRGGMNLVRGCDSLSRGI